MTQVSGLATTDPTAEEAVTPSPARRAVSARRSVLGPRALRVLRSLSPVLVLVAWQLLSSFGILDERTLASPVQLAGTAWELIRTGQLQEAIAVSARRAALGFLLGALIAFVLGGIVGLTALGDALVDPLVQMLRLSLIHI